MNEEGEEEKDEAAAEDEEELVLLRLGDPPRVTGEPLDDAYLNRSLCRKAAFPLPRHASLTSLALRPSLAAHSAPERYSSSTSPVTSSKRSTGLKPPGPAPLGLPCAPLGLDVPDRACEGLLGRGNDDDAAAAVAASDAKYAAAAA